MSFFPLSCGLFLCFVFRRRRLAHSSLLRQINQLNQSSGAQVFGACSPLWKLGEARNYEMKFERKLHNKGGGVGGFNLVVVQCPVTL
jgi:hypothetical protein